MRAAGHLAPLEEKVKRRAKVNYLLKHSNKFYRIDDEGNKVKEYEVDYDLLTEDEKEELDLLINNSTEEEFWELLQSLGDVEELVTLLETEEEANSLNNFVKIPVLGTIACGDPILAEENIESYRFEYPDNLPNGNLFFLKTKGDSMEPTIPDNCHVLIKVQEEVENGQIAAVRFVGENEVTLKRVKKQGNIILLIPDNPKYEAIIVTEDNPVSIIGKAVRYTVDL
ncbi:XRE family transcriptional regulator [Lysinibacillus sp. SGAir0095]|nr:XRE family transcriptional regulator [Lysinibacillus sp. SGAir0095]